MKRTFENGYVPPDPREQPEDAEKAEEEARQREAGRTHRAMERLETLRDDE